MNFIARILFENLSLLRGMPPAARVVTLLFFGAGLADGTLMPFFPLWARSEGGVPVEFVGLLLACYAAGELIAMPVVGGIADRVGRRPVLLISTLGVGCGFLLLYWAHGVVAVALSLLVIGVFESVLHPTAATVLTDVVPGPALRDHFALTRVASDAGHVIGPAFGALLVQHSLGMVFAGCAVVLLTGATAVALFLPETRASDAAPGEDDDDDATAIFAVFRDRRLAALLVPIALTGIAASWIETVLPLFAADGGILTAAGVGFLFSYAALLSVVFQLPLTQASADIPADWMIWVSGVALVAAFGSLLVSSQLPFLVVAVSLLALSQMLAGPLTQAMSSDLAPTHSRATYMAAYSAVNDVRDAAGPAIGTTLYALAARLPWLVGVPITLLATLVLARSAKGERRRQGTYPVPAHTDIVEERQMLAIDTLTATACGEAKHRVLRTRQETRRRNISVAKVERVTPAMARITFTAPDLADFSSPAHDDHVKLFFPDATTVSEPLKRDYTPRRFDAARRQLVIDFVLHDGGPATSWAKNAAIGDVLEIGGPRGSTLVPDDFDWYLLMGDETALPAIGRRVEELRPGVQVTTLLVVKDTSERQAFATAADLRALWVERQAVGEDDAASLLRTLEGLDMPDGDGFVWIAAEADVARTLRRHMLEVRGHTAAWVKAAGYWVRGRDGAYEGFKGE